MKDCFRRFLLSSLGLLIFAGAFFGSCTDVDNRLGWGLLPDDQELVFSQAILDGVGSYMAFPDSIPVNQRNLMMLGNYTTDGYGYIRSGALIQFTPMSFSTGTDFWGYKPVVDSAKILLSVAQVYGDTAKESKFYMYRLKEVVPVDSVYYPGFPGEDYADMDDPVFSFTLKSEGTGTIVKNLEFESGADRFLEDLVNVDTDIYNDYTYMDSLFREVMHGFYIAPSKDPDEAPLDAALYLIYPLSTYDTYYGYGRYDDTELYVYGHSLYESPDEEEKTDPIIIDGETFYLKDTVTTIYSFDDSYLTYRNTNIMVLDRSYESYPSPPSNLVNPDDFIKTNDFTSGAIPSYSPFYVQGLLGVAGYLDFGDEFLRQLHDLCTVDGERRIMKVNRALLHIWVKEEGVPYLDKAPSRLGMYYDYKGYAPKAIPDYGYAAEALQYTISYDGYLNRGMGYYEMDITTYVTELANESDQTQKQIWLAPGATLTELYAPTQVALLNPPDTGGDSDHKRISLELTYTLVKNTVDE